MIWFRHALSYRSFGATIRDRGEERSAHRQHTHTHASTCIYIYVYVRVNTQTGHSLTYAHGPRERATRSASLSVIHPLTFSLSLSPCLYRSRALSLSLSLYETRILREQRAITTTCYSCRRANSPRASSV